MTRSKRVQTIVKLNQHKERVAARQLAVARSSLDTIKQRLQQMLSFRDEYTQLLKASNQSQPMNVLRERQAFILQMDQGIKMLREQLSIQEQMNEQERQHWLKQKTQLDTMQSIYERCVSAENQLRALRLQQKLDETATRNAIINR